MIPKTRPNLKIRVSPMVEILRVKITLGTLCQLMSRKKFRKIEEVISLEPNPDQMVNHFFSDKNTQVHRYAWGNGNVDSSLLLLHGP